MKEYNINDLYVVIVVYNTSCQDSISYNRAKDSSVKIIVCDNSTSDYGNEIECLKQAQSPELLVDDGCQEKCNGDCQEYAGACQHEHILKCSGCLIIMKKGPVVLKSNKAVGLLLNPIPSKKGCIDCAAHRKHNDCPI